LSKRYTYLIFLDYLMFVKKLMAYLILGIGLILLPSVVYAKQFTGADLLEDCQAAIKFIENNGNNEFILNGSMCMAYLDGFEDVHRIYSILMEVKRYPKNLRMYCLPINTTDLQLAKVIVKYLNDYPGRIGEPAASLLIDAFALAFPCPR
jgi:hypothetical protein